MRFFRTLRILSMLVLSVVSHGDGDYFTIVLLFMIYNESSGLGIRFDSEPLLTKSTHSLKLGDSFLRGYPSQTSRDFEVTNRWSSQYRIQFNV